MVLKLAWRNLWRNKRRTIITVASILFGLVITIFSLTIADGGYGGMIDSAARFGSGHVTVEAASYRESMTTSHYMTLPPDLEGAILGLPEVETVAPRISGDAVIQSGHGTVGVMMMGVDPKLEIGFSTIDDKIVEGVYLEAGDDKGVVIGAVMAEKLDVQVGSKLVVMTTNVEGDIASELVKVRGIFKTGSDVFDGFTCHITMDKAQKLLGYSPDQMTQAAIIIDSHRDAEYVADEIDGLIAGTPATSGGDEGMVALTWDEVMVDLASYIKVDGSFNYVMMVIIFLVVASGIFNTIYMSVMERRREFGVMLAAGASPGSILSMVLLESLLIGVMGCLLGGVAGLAIARYFVTNPIDLSAAMGEGSMSVSNFAIEPYMYAEIVPLNVAVLLSLVLLLCVTIGLFPARSAANTRPVEALKVD